MEMMHTLHSVAFVRALFGHYLVYNPVMSSLDLFDRFPIFIYLFSFFGSGLLTFADGTHGLPRNEGLFDGTRLVERQRAKEIVTKAKQAAQTAKNVQVRV